MPVSFITGCLRENIRSCLLLSEADGRKDGRKNGRTDGLAARERRGENGTELHTDGDAGRKEERSGLLVALFWWHSAAGANGGSW